MVINGIEFDIDFTDADTLEKVEKGYDKIEEAIKNFEKNSENKKQSEMVKEMCIIMRDFLDDIFGEGSSDKIFENKYSLMKCAKVYAMVKDEWKKQLNTFSEIASKYSPERLER